MGQKQLEAYYKSLSQNERLDALKNDAVEQYEKLMKRDLEQIDLDEMKSRLSEIDIALNDMELQKKELVAPINIRIKEAKDTHAILLRDLKNKYYEINEVVFDVDDQEAGVMHTFDNQGNLIATRNLTPQEKQARIKIMMNKKSIKRITGTDDEQS